MADLNPCPQVHVDCCTTKPERTKNLLRMLAAKSTATTDPPKGVSAFTTHTVRRPVTQLILLGLPGRQLHEMAQQGQTTYPTS